MTTLQWRRNNKIKRRLICQTIWKLRFRKIHTCWNCFREWKRCLWWKPTLRGREESTGTGSTSVWKNISNLKCQSSSQITVYHNPVVNRTEQNSNFGVSTTMEKSVHITVNHCNQVYSYPTVFFTFNCCSKCSGKTVNLKYSSLLYHLRHSTLYGK